MARETIETPKAPQAIGTYSQAVKIGNTVYLSGQVPFVPETMSLLDGTMRQQTEQVFKNLSAVAEAAGGGLQNIVKMTVYLVDLEHFAIVNEVMEAVFEPPYPARAVVGVAALPKDAPIEIDAILSL